MFSNSIKTTFPFHTSRDKTHNKRSGSEGDYKPFYLKFEANKLAPFQIDVDVSVTGFNYVRIRSAKTDAVVKNLASVSGVYQSYVNSDGDNAKRFIHFGDTAIEALDDGAYYVEVSFNNSGGTYYSEDFIMRQLWS